MENIGEGTGTITSFIQALDEAKTSKSAINFFLGREKRIRGRNLFSVIQQSILLHMVVT